MPDSKTLLGIKAIDVHGHFGSYDEGDKGLRASMMSGGIEVVRRRAKAANIRLTVVSAIRALMPYGGDVLRGNQNALAVAEEHSDICFWAVLNPKLHETYKQVESLLKHPRCKGIKIHPTRHFYDIRDFGEQIFEFASSCNAIILTHSGCHGANPEDFLEFITRYPDVTLIIAHLGNSADEHFSRQVHSLKKLENKKVFIDTSSSKSIYSGLVEWAVQELGSDRLLFGSDTPLHFTWAQKARIEYAEIQEKEKKAILFENAAQLFCK